MICLVVLGEEGEKTRSWGRFFSNSIWFYSFVPKSKVTLTLWIQQNSRWGHSPKHHLFLLFLFNFNCKDLSFSCCGGWRHTNDQRILCVYSMHNFRSFRLSVCIGFLLLCRGCRWGRRLHRFLLLLFGFLLLLFGLLLCSSLRFLETRRDMFSNAAEEIQELFLFCICSGKAQHGYCD